MAYMLDENVPHPVLNALLSFGVDAVLFPGPKASPDKVVLQTSVALGRTLITCDKDFGDLIFREGRASIGVVLVRTEVLSRKDAEQVARDVIGLPDSGRGAFYVISKSGIRAQALPVVE